MTDFKEDAKAIFTMLSDELRVFMESIYRPHAFTTIEQKEDYLYASDKGEYHYDITFSMSFPKEDECRIVFTLFDHDDVSDSTRRTEKVCKYEMTLHDCPADRTMNYSRLGDFSRAMRKKVDLNPYGNFDHKFF